MVHIFCSFLLFSNSLNIINTILEGVHFAPGSPLRPGLPYNVYNVCNVFIFYFFFFWIRLLLKIEERNFHENTEPFFKSHNFDFNFFNEKFESTYYNDKINLQDFFSKPKSDSKEALFRQSSNQKPKTVKYYFL